MSLDARQGMLSRLRGWRPEARPWWSWTGFGSIAVLSLVLFVWGLSHNGMGNAYYAAAVKSGSISWKAWFFGALDPGSFITVDKLPASLWAGGLFARAFGFSSWSILLPQALAGVGSVLILFHLVRRWCGDVAAILAGLAFAFTPVAVAIFRMNNPDALLTLLLLGAAWTLWSALEKGSTWKLVLCGVLMGFAFLTKMLEAFVVLPALAMTYLVCGPHGWGRRSLQLLAAAGSLAITGGWWVTVVQLWPAPTRPYIGGSRDNSALGLIFSRSAGLLGSSGPVPNFSGSPGWLRLFNFQLGGQIAWLIPLALAGMVAGLWWTRRGSRTYRARAGFLFWGTWALTCLIVFSVARGVIHPYYTVVLAPSLAALIGSGTVALWHLGRAHRWLAWLLPAAAAGTAVLARSLLGRTPGYAPGLGTGILVMAAAGALGLLAVMVLPGRGRALVLATGILALAGALAGPAAYSVSTVARTVDGTFATAGPEAAMRFAFLRAGVPVPQESVLRGELNPSAGLPPTGGRGLDGTGPGGGAEPGGAGTAAIDPRLVNFLLANRDSARFVVAVQGSQIAAPLILATGEPVVTMGGFNGSDPAPTLAQFQEMVALRQVRYVLLGNAGLGPAPGAFAAASAIARWVRGTGELVDPGKHASPIDGLALYQLW